MGTYEALQRILTQCTPVLLPATKYRHFGPLEAPEMLVEHMVRFLEPDDDIAGESREQASWTGT